MDESVVERGKDSGDAKDKFYGSTVSVKETTADHYILGQIYRTAWARGASDHAPFGGIFEVVRVLVGILNARQ